MIYLGTFNTTRQSLNQVIAAYIAKQPKLTGLTVTLTETTIRVSYTLTTLGNLLHLLVTMTFDPSLPDDHHLVLSLETFSEAIFKGPRGFVLEKIAEQFKLPAGVSLDTEQAKVIISLPELVHQDGLNLRLLTFNLQKDQFILAVDKKF